MPEVDIFIAQDGHQYILNSAVSRNRTVLSDDGTGMPPIDYVTERGPYQHGETLHDYWLRPRVVQLLIRQNFCSRQEYWDGRTALLDAIRPNRGLRGVLRKVLPNGAQRDLEVVIQEGPRFEPRDITRWDEWSLQETLRFIAHNPVYYDPTQFIIDFTPPVCSEFTYTFPFDFCLQQQLVFPFTFPFLQFTGWDVGATIDYDGTWIEYPTFVVTGPLTAFAITNETTDEVIEFEGFSLAESENITIELSYGTKTATKSDGTNMLPYITAASNLNDFHLAIGSNRLTARATYHGSSTLVTMYWRERFIGI